MRLPCPKKSVLNWHQKWVIDYTHQLSDGSQPVVPSPGRTLRGASPSQSKAPTPPNQPTVIFRCRPAGEDNGDCVPAGRGTPLPSRGMARRAVTARRRMLIVGIGSFLVVYFAPLAQLEADGRIVGEWVGRG